MVEKVSKKLATWKRNYISLGGRITLIKVALSNIPVYYMSLYRMPQTVVYSIERLQREFLWERSGQKKDHLVRWEIVIQPKEQGRLGLGRIKEKNWHCWESGCGGFLRSKVAYGIPLFAVGMEVMQTGGITIIFSLAPSL